MSKFTLEFLMLMGMVGVYHGQGATLSRYKTSLQSHTVQDGLVFYTGRTTNFYMCSSLCGRYAGCRGVQYRPGQPGMCVLLSGPDIHPPLILRPEHVCHSDNCTPEQVCVPTESATDYICLETGDQTPDQWKDDKSGDFQTLVQPVNFSTPTINRHSQDATLTPKVNPNSNQPFSVGSVQQDSSVSSMDRQQGRQAKTAGRNASVTQTMTNEPGKLQNISISTVNKNIYKSARTTTHQVPEISTEQTVDQKLIQPISLVNPNSKKSVISREHLNLSSVAITKKAQNKSAGERIDQSQATRSTNRHLHRKSRNQRVNINHVPRSTQTSFKHRQRQTKQTTDHRTNQSIPVVKHDTLPLTNSIPVKQPIHMRQLGESKPDITQMYATTAPPVNTTATVAYDFNHATTAPYRNTETLLYNNTVTAPAVNNTASAPPVNITATSLPPGIAATPPINNTDTASLITFTATTPPVNSQQLGNSAPSDHDIRDLDHQPEDYSTISSFKKTVNKYLTTQLPLWSASSGHMMNSSDDTMISISSDFKKACRRRKGCSNPQLHCINRQCVCEVGYLWSPLSSTCQKNCTKFGDDMVPYPDNGIYQHNNVCLKRMSQEECYTACLKSTITCLSFDHNRIVGHCYLSNVTWFDVDLSERLWNDQLWTLFLRQCI